MILTTLTLLRIALLSRMIQIEVRSFANDLAWFINDFSHLDIAYQL